MQMTTIAHPNIRRVSQTDGRYLFIIILLGISARTFTTTLLVSYAWIIVSVTTYIEWEEDGKSNVVIETSGIHTQVLLEMEETGISDIGAV